MLKRTVSFLLCTCLLSAPAACGSNEPQETQPQDPYAASRADMDALSTVYSTAKDAKEHFEHFKVGDFVCGPVGIRMVIGDAVMGSETAFAGQRVVFSVGDFHKSAYDPTHKYQVELHSDKGDRIYPEAGGSYPDDLLCL